MRHTFIALTAFMSIALTLCSFTSYAEQPNKIILNGKVSEQYQAPQNEPGIVGLDMQITPNHYPLVMNIFSGTPAESAGIKPGDIIIEIDGQPTWGKNSQTVDWMISDVPGTPVKFTCRRGEHIYETSLKVAPRSSLRSNLRQKFSP